MNDIRADQLATIHRLASDFIAKLEADGFHRSAIASALTALGINLATSCNDPGALALVIEAALREMSPGREKAKSALDGIRTLWRSSRMSLCVRELLRVARGSCAGSGASAATGRF